MLKRGLLIGTDERNRQTFAIRTARRAADAVHIVFGVVRNIKIDDQTYVVDVDAPGNDVGCDEDVGLTGFEVAHYLFALRLLEVGVHFRYVELQPAQRRSQIFDLGLRRREDDDALRLGAAEQVLDDGQFLGLVADVCRLHDGFRGPGDGNLDFCGIF